MREEAFVNAARHAQCDRNLEYNVSNSDITEFYKECYALQLESRVRPVDQFGSNRRPGARRLRTDWRDSKALVLLMGGVVLLDSHKAQKCPYEDNSEGVVK